MQSDFITPDAVCGRREMEIVEGCAAIASAAVAPMAVQSPPPNTATTERASPDRSKTRAQNAHKLRGEELAQTSAPRSMCCT